MIIIIEHMYKTVQHVARGRKSEVGRLSFYRPIHGFGFHLLRRISDIERRRMGGGGGGRTEIFETESGCGWLGGE